MIRKAVLSVALNDVAGNVVSDARVELRAGEGGRWLLSFDERLGAYVSEPMEPGEYTLSVRSEGYDAQ